MRLLPRQTPAEAPPRVSRSNPSTASAPRMAAGAGGRNERDPRPILFLRAYLGKRPDAVGRAMLELAGALAVLHEPVIWALHEPALAPVVGVRVEAIGKRMPAFLSRSRAAGQIAFLFLAAARLIRQRQRFAVVVCVDTPTGVGWLGVLAQKLSGGSTRYFAWVMDMYFAYVPAPARFLTRYEARVRMAIDAANYKQADIVITLGRCMVDRLTRLSVASGRIRVIPPWATPVHRDIGGDLRREWRLESVTVVLYSGYAGVRHPLRSLIDAAHRLQTDTDHHLLHFLFVGSGPAWDAARQTAEGLGLQNVSFKPAVARDQLDELLGLGDVHVAALASGATGTCVPSKAYAAMAAGRPLLFIGSSNCQVAVDLAEAQGGLSVDGEHIDTLLRAILSLTTESAKSTYGARALDFQAHERSLAAGTNQWLTLLNPK